ncbi:Wzz/FepE/Etk N-terminal domain-containing protein [Oceanisphaera pacifica]|uniref:Polysaccharide chain length determinant N-terminal domain-containing protein n=1 Tax=Oceanisphaera pacifica TaxID=2818389 RepID=A0ABS3NGR1_9GAMM|nr:Wzz/FepE/Etk N-terminal domain-containing protein [Oceanisphaera pacifica]MBO1519747.1 hypothetical protein [Oceanisphaera pacifica]
MNQTPQKQDAQFSQSHYQSSYHDDAISFVDLAKILVKRWKLMVAIFVVVVAVGSFYAFTLAKMYEYTSVYSVAETTVGKKLEPMTGLQSKIKNVYLPQQVRTLLQQESLPSLPFNMNISSPKGSALIVLTSKSSEVNKELVTALHSSILKQLKTEQDNQVARRVDFLQQRIASTKQKFEALNNADSPKESELAASLMTTIDSLELAVANFNPSSIKAKAIQSLNAKGTSKKLIMALSIVFASFLAVLGAFFREFYSQVYYSLQKDKKSSHI